MCSLLRKRWMTTRIGNQMPNQDQKFPYVLPDAGSDRRWCLQASRSHCWSGSQREYQTDLSCCIYPLAILSFFRRGGAPESACLIAGEWPEAKQQPLAEQKQPTSQNERKESLHVFLLLPNDKLEVRS